MRLKKKYKHYNQLETISSKFPKRLERFKRPKWKKIQVFITKKLRSKRRLINQAKLKSPYTVWSKLQRFYKEGTLKKYFLYCYFDESFSIKYFNKLFKTTKISNRNQLFLNFFLKLEYRLDILLWRLNFFNSTYQARQYIKTKQILINEKRICSSCFLKKGDIITFNKNFNLNKIDIKTNKALFSKNETVFTFFEVDYYINTIIILKNIEDLNQQDMYSLNSYFYDLKSIKDFFFK